MAVSVRDHGYDALVAKLGPMARGRAVDVGIMGSEADQVYDGGETVADIASQHEFGLGVPERSFIRAYVDENRAEIERAIREMAKRVVSGELPSFDYGLNLIGVKVQKEIVVRIKAGIAPPLSQVTMDRKGSSVPLIDTGQLWSSITYALKQLGEGT